MLSPWVSLIFASWQGYADTLSLVHFARQESATLQVVSTNNLQISQTCICLLLNEITQAHNSAPHQNLLEVPTSMKLMTTTLPLSCSNIVKTYDCMFFLESDCTLIFGSFYSPLPQGGGCGWYLDHVAYSAVGKHEIRCLGSVIVRK